MTTESKRLEAAQRAIDAAGGPVALALKINEHLGPESVTRLTVMAWRAKGVPEGWTTTVEHLTGVPREELNPQMYQVEKIASASNCTDCGVDLSGIKSTVKAVSARFGPYYEGPPICEDCCSARYEMMTTLSERKQC